MKSATRQSPFFADLLTLFAVMTVKDDDDFSSSSAAVLMLLMNQEEL